MSRYFNTDVFLKSVKQKAYPQSGSVNESERKISLFGIMEILTAMPTADVIEVVHADWIKNWEIGWSACSHCGKGYLWEDYKGVADWKYCPNCGAKIDSRREIERGNYEVH